MLNVKISLNNKQTSYKLTRLSCVNPEGGGLGSGPPPYPPLDNYNAVDFLRNTVMGLVMAFLWITMVARPLGLLHIMF